MSPDSDHTFTHSLATLSTGRRYYYIDQNPNNPDKYGTTFLCVHGFPDLSYGWKHQILPWVAQGYRVIVPDMLGYGKTDMPLEASAYTTKRLCDDLAALLDHLGIEKAIVIGHDWGAYVAGRFALWHPERLLALALLSQPYTPPSMGYVSVEELVQRYPPFGYLLYFASKQSTIDIEAHVRETSFGLLLFFRLSFRKPFSTEPLGQFRNFSLSGVEPDGCILSDKELDHHASNFQRGMTGPLSYYRTSQLRFQEEKDAALPSELPSDLPVLFLYGTEDPTTSPAAVRNMGKFIHRLKVVPIVDVGHWVMLEAPHIVTMEILLWLKSALGLRVPTRL